MKYTVLGSLAILVLIALGWLFTAIDYGSYKFWAPKYANVQRDVFENTKSYQQGTIQNLRSEKFAYDNATDPAVKQALAQNILHEVADYPLQNLPPDLATFIASLRN